MESYDDFCASLQELKDATFAKQTSWRKDWYSGYDFSTAFEDDALRVFISDMYTALNPNAIRDLQINIVVNMMGPPDLHDTKRKLYGPQVHYDEDSTSTGWKEHWDKNMDQQRLEAAHSYFQHGGRAFYEKMGVHYVEEAAADDWHNVVAQHFPNVNKQVLESIQAMMRDPSKQAKKIHVLFHCYGGRNRSAVAMCAFWFLWRANVAVDNVPMTEVIKQAVKARPEVLTKGRKNHDNFLRNLISYEKGVLSALGRL